MRLMSRSLLVVTMYFALLGAQFMTARYQAVEFIHRELPEYELSVGFFEQSLLWALLAFFALGVLMNLLVGWPQMRTESSKWLDAGRALTRSRCFSFAALLTLIAYFLALSAPMVGGYIVLVCDGLLAAALLWRIWEWRSVHVLLLRDVVPVANRTYETQ